MYCERMRISNLHSAKNMVRVLLGDGSSDRPIGIQQRTQVDGYFKCPAVRVPSYSLVTAVTRNPNRKPDRLETL